MKSMNILVIDNGTTYLENIKGLLTGNTVVVRRWSDPSALQGVSADLVIFSGGHDIPVLGHEKEFEDEIEFVKNTHIPVLGICLGFEIIARAFGVLPKILTKKEKGIVEIYPKVSEPIFEGVGKGFLVYESHRWAIGRAPEEFVSLADSSDGVEIMRHKKRMIYGFQFHPEMLVEKTEGRRIFENFFRVVLQKAST